MTKENKAPKRVAHGWSKESLLTKAQRAIEEMHKYGHDDWRFAHWSTIALELLARAALANISPTLLADHPKDGNANNLLYALGYEPKAAKFVPHSVSIATVFERLKAVVPKFTAEICTSCVAHMSVRNAEMHSGTPAFEGLKTSSWLPDYYHACLVLLHSMGHDLASFIGKESADAAVDMIVAANDKSAKMVQKTIAERKRLWKSKSETDRQKLAAQASLWAQRSFGHRHKCPACTNDGLINGSGIAPPLKTINGNLITETQQFLPSRYECIACGLKISGLAQLSACGLGDTYKYTAIYDAAEYYAQSDELDGYEEDNNEP